MIKRTLDITGAAVALLLLSPLILIVASLVWARLGKPVLFRQQRPGLKGKAFDLFKFRTMTDKCDQNGILLSSDERLTPFGSWLRAASLDELPSLWNIVKGDMSFVGPRPLLMSYLPLYSAEQGRRHDVRPGLTGWAQVNGRNALSWEEKFQLDIWYVDNRGLWLDLKILAKTVYVVLRKTNINTVQGKIMGRFEGSRDR